MSLTASAHRRPLLAASAPNIGDSHRQSQSKMSHKGVSPRPTKDIWLQQIATVFSTDHKDTRGLKLPEFVPVHANYIYNI